MNSFRGFLALVFLIIFSYTCVVIANHGLGLLPIFFGDMREMGWPGQFNLDFMCMLILSGLWVSWRHQFSGEGLLLGLLAFFFGAPFLCVYLFVQSYKCEGDLPAILLGQGRSSHVRPSN